ncbi:LemA family protein [Zeimonas arvi]|uniref:LemA family protein n=1 Tax=Zeimonas arvi TaxID=2498847 RepID=A0A5C8NUJ5_9BURK|nr:LemA family protein [Zeimonas arvi]TXL64856.1 LemA family protein [Zeimonas arvi]
MTWIVLAAIVAALAAWGVSIYNGLVKRRNLAEEGWSGIDVQLKRRADLVPNLVETVKGYATHERELLENVTELRNQARAAPAGDVAARSQIEGMLSGALGRLLAIVENYPELKANQNFLALQESLQGVEHDIQMARRYYNGATRDLNVMVESFPSNLVAGWFGFGKKPFFEIEDAAAREAPKVSFPQ